MRAAASWDSHASSYTLLHERPRTGCPARKSTTQRPPSSEERFNGFASFRLSPPSALRRREAGSSRAPGRETWGSLALPRRCGRDIRNWHVLFAPLPKVVGTRATNCLRALAGSRASLLALRDPPTHGARVAQRVYLASLVSRERTHRLRRPHVEMRGVRSVTHLVSAQPIPFSSCLTQHASEWCSRPTAQSCSTMARARLNSNWGVWTSAIARRHDPRLTRGVKPIETRGSRQIRASVSVGVRTGDRG